MNKLIYKSLAILALVIAFNSCSQADKSTVNVAQTELDIRDIAKAKNIELPDLPWHMMNVFWNFKEPVTDFQRLDIDVTIDRDVPESYNLYISPINSDFNGQMFYGGLQTNIGGWENAEDQIIVNKGKGGIFSRWSKDQTTPINLDYVDRFEDGLFESAGYEGEFCSVRRPYKWTAGTYTVSLVKEETIDFKNSKHSWVSMSYTNKATGEVRPIGRLLFSGETLHMRQNVIAFVEIYGHPEKANVPEATITFGYPKINGKEIAMENVIARQIPDGLASSPHCAHVTSAGKDVSVHITPQVRVQTENPITEYISLK